MKNNIKRGDIVVDVADSRHHGIVQSIHLTRGKYYATVRWLSTNWRTFRVPLEDLRPVPDEMAGFDGDMESDIADEGSLAHFERYIDGSRR